MPASLASDVYSYPANGPMRKAYQVDQVDHYLHHLNHQLDHQLDNVDAVHLDFDIDKLDPVHLDHDIDNLDPEPAVNEMLCI